MKQFRFLVLSVAALTLCATTLVAQNAPQTDTEDKVLYMLDGRVVDKEYIENYPDQMIKDINVIENIESVVMVKSYPGEVMERINGGSGHSKGPDSEFIEVFLDFSEFKPKEYIGDKYVVRIDMSKPFPERPEPQPVKSHEENYYDLLKYDEEGRLYINQEEVLLPFKDSKVGPKLEPVPVPEGVEPFVQIFDKDGNKVDMDIRDITPDMIGSMSVLNPGGIVLIDGEERENIAGVVTIRLK
ncbi:MAG: hypothetical protein IIU82_03215 [Tidjanibacter sp.]|nr:hypothetical protein [Tidjanibacter sp.]